MSGRPNPDGVKKLQQALRDFAWTRERIVELECSLREQEKSLELRTIELRGQQAAIGGLLSEMDVASPGNHGYEQRRLELLLMMAKGPAL